MKPRKLLPLMLATGLQFMPLARAVLPAAHSQALAPAWAMVLRMAAGAIALLGSYDAVSGATAIAGPRTVNAVLGRPFVLQLVTSGETAHSWSANTAPLRAAVYPLVPGLYMTNRTGRIGGIPTQAGTFNFTITAWENSGNSGHHISAVYTFNVTQDLDKPIVTITSPSAPITTVMSNRFRLAGQARDAGGISNVFLLPAGAGAILADGTTNWSAWVELAPGTNRFRVKALDRWGNASATNMERVIVYIVTSPLGLSTTGSGAILGATNGQPLVVGRAYTLTAQPGSGHLFSNWGGRIVSSSNVLRFIMQSNFMLTAQFVPNPFPAAAGNYNGLYYDPADLQPGSAGFVTVTVLPTGAFSASLRNGLRKSPFTGRFDLGGRATKQVLRPGTNALTVDLNLDLQGGNVIAGRVSDGSWSSSLAAHRAVFQAATNPATLFATNYTLLLPGALDASLAPPGSSFATMKVDRSGAATLNGALADATPFAHKAPVSGTGLFPVYAPLYGGKGSIFGWWRVRPTSGIDLDGAANWIRPPGAPPKLYTNGFLLGSAVQGSVYTPPGTNRVLDLDAAFLEFNPGDFTFSFTNTVALGPYGRVANTGPNQLTMTVAPATGLFTGKTTPSGMTSALLFKGVLLQRQGMGGGFFPGTNQSGHVYFGP